MEYNSRNMCLVMPTVRLPPGTMNYHIYIQIFPADLDHQVEIGDLCPTCRTIRESSHERGASEDFKNFLSYEHEELGVIITPNMASNAFAQAIRPILLFSINR